MKLRHTSQSGQSLIEVTFAAAVVALVLVGILSTVIASLQSARISLEQSQATQWANATTEWIRGQRDAQGWGVFYGSLIARGNPQTYCLTALPSTFASWLSLPLGACGETDVIPNTLAKRELTITFGAGPPQTATVTVTITRPSRSGTTVSTNETVLADWE